MPNEDPNQRSVSVMIHFMRRDTHQLTRREFLVASAAGLLQAADPVPIIDIHQHTHYSGRPDDVLVKHQRTQVPLRKPQDRQLKLL